MIAHLRAIFILAFRKFQSYFRKQYSLIPVSVAIKTPSKAWFIYSVDRYRE